MVAYRPESLKAKLKHDHVEDSRLKIGLGSDFCQGTVVVANIERVTATGGGMPGYKNPGMKAVKTAG